MVLSRTSARTTLQNTSVVSSIRKVQAYRMTRRPPLTCVRCCKHRGSEANEEGAACCSPSPASPGDSDTRSERRGRPRSLQNHAGSTEESCGAAATRLPRPALSYMPDHLRSARRGGESARGRDGDRGLS